MTYIIRYNRMICNYWSLFLWSYQSSTNAATAPPSGIRFKLQCKTYLPPSNKSLFLSFHSFLRQRGTRTFAHLQQDRPLRHVDPVRASRRPHGRHADRPHRALSSKLASRRPRQVVASMPLTHDLLRGPQVRRAILQMLFPTKAFNWLRHIAIALTLLTLINMLVIFAPNILGIFGIIGRFFTALFYFIFFTLSNVSFLRDI